MLTKEEERRKVALELSMRFYESKSNNPSTRLVKETADEFLKYLKGTK